jgi:cell division protein FtsW
MQELIKKLQGDRVIWMVVVFLSIISLLSVYSSISTLAYKADGNSFKFLVKHILMLGLGFLVMYYVHKVPHKYFARLSVVAIWVAGIMLLMTLLIGVEINDAKRWLRVPFIGMTFQTSDFAKIVLIVYVARMLNVKRTMLHDFKNGVLPILYPVGIFCVLIMPADLSTALMLGLICLLLMFIGGVPGRHLLKVVGLAFAAVMVVFLLGKAAPNLIRTSTWETRVVNFFSPADEAGQFGNDQVVMAKYAIYDGKLLPQGPGSGSSRNFLPHPYSDMIFAFIIQEYGSIIGGIGLVLLYIILLFRSIKTSLRCKKHFAGLMVIGLSFMLVIQALTNMAVAVGLFPTTGQTLPMVSMGGTSILFASLAIGMILSVSRLVHNTEETGKKKNKNQEYAAA